MAFFLLDRAGKFLERLAPHVVRFNQFHTVDILDHNGIERCNGSVRPVHQIVRIPKHNPHYHNGQNQRHQCKTSANGIFTVIK